MPRNKPWNHAPELTDPEFTLIPETIPKEGTMVKNNKYTSAAGHVKAAANNVERAQLRLQQAMIGLPKKAVALRENIREHLEALTNWEARGNAIAAQLIEQGNLPKEGEESNAGKPSADD